MLLLNVTETLYQRIQRLVLDYRHALGRPRCPQCLKGADMPRLMRRRHMYQILEDKDAPNVYDTDHVNDKYRENATAEPRYCCYLLLRCIYSGSNYPHNFAMACEKQETTRPDEDGVASKGILKKL